MFVDGWQPDQYQGEELPGPPGRPKVASVGSRYVSIDWSSPVSVGTAPIDGYRVWSRRGGEGSFLVQIDDTCEGDVLSARVPVTPGAWFEFCVAAISSVGQGPQSDPSLPILTRERGGMRRQRGGDRRKRGGGRRGRGEAEGVLLSSSDDEREDDGKEKDEPSSSTALIKPGDGRSAARRAADVAEAAYARARADAHHWEEYFEKKHKREPSDVEVARSPRGRRAAAAYAVAKKAMAEADEVVRREEEERRAWQEGLKGAGWALDDGVWAAKAAVSRWEMAFAMKAHDGECQCCLHHHLHHLHLHTYASTTRPQADRRRAPQRREGGDGDGGAHRRAEGRRQPPKGAGPRDVVPSARRVPGRISRDDVRRREW